MLLIYSVNKILRKIAEVNLQFTYQRFAIQIVFLHLPDSIFSFFMEEDVIGPLLLRFDIVN